MKLLLEQECMSWLFWQMGSAPYLGGGFGHFYAYAPEKFEYPINRFAMEVKCQLDVLDKNLSSRQYLCGDDYNISDIAVHSWYGSLVLNNIYVSQQNFLMLLLKRMLFDGQKRLLIDLLTKEDLE